MREWTSRPIWLVVLIFAWLGLAGCGSPERPTFNTPRVKIVKNLQPTPQLTVIPDSEGESYLRFIAIGDQGNGGSTQLHVARLMNEKARRDSLDLVITVGDNFYSHGVYSVLDPQWVEKFESIYDLPYLDKPFYAVLGNHDHHYDNGQYQVEYSALSEKWNMPHFFYTFTRQIDSTSSVQFFGLDTDIIKQEGEYDLEQVAWLEQELRRSTATWKIVFGHHPLFSHGKHGSEKRLIELLQPVFQTYGIDVYIAGHDHDRQHLRVNGLDYIISGTASKSRDTSYGRATIFAATNLGFAWFRVSRMTMHMHFIDTNGEIEYAHTWRKDAVSEKSDNVLSIR